jgi:hypothetical protein
MSLKLQNKKKVSLYLRQYGLRIEKALIYNLEVLVTELQNHAKLNAGYQDQTGNLKASIGGVVLKNGHPVTYRGFEGSTEGTTAGMDYINSLIGSFKKGYALLVVAGMEYASYVEDIHGLNVLKKSELKMNRELPALLKELKRKIR